MLTELEGAVLTEIGFRGMGTAFRVRSAFKSSASSEWQGSAGSVYPAIKRLIERGLIHAKQTTDGRGTQRLSLTQLGQKSLDEWSKNLKASLSIGMDPFRLRAGMWSQLAVADQLHLAKELLGQVDLEIAVLLAYREGQDELEAIQADLAIELQKLRRNWLLEWKARLKVASQASA